MKLSIVFVILSVTVFYGAVASQPIGYFPFTNLRRQHRRNTELLKEINSLEFNAERRAMGQEFRTGNERNSSHQNDLVRYDAILDSLIPVLATNSKAVSARFMGGGGAAQRVEHDNKEFQMDSEPQTGGDVDVSPMEQLRSHNQVQMNQLSPEDVLALISSRVPNEPQPSGSNCKMSVAIGTSGYRISCRALRSLNQALKGEIRADADYLRMSASLDEMVDRLRNESKSRQARHVAEQHVPQKPARIALVKLDR